MSTYLTDEEVKKLTGGLSQPAAQSKFLKGIKIHHVLNNDGVVVARAWLDNAPFYNDDARISAEAVNEKLPNIGMLGGQN